MRPQVGQVINNKYRLIQIIGDGGMGSVYKAQHELLSNTVALKFLHPELSKRSGLVQRFLQEAQVSVQIQSPHVVRVIDVDQQQGGLAYIVMEYLEGRTLQTLYEDLYKAGQRLSYPDAMEYAMQMLEGVEAAHTAGIVHRDLKPDNVIITKDKRGEPLLKLLDFGIAKLKVTGQLDRGLTRPGVVMGTPEYMAPEQAYSADTVGPEADIFSLGVMIFEMLAGRRPVGGDEPQQIASAYITGQIAKLTDLAPNLPPALGAVVHKAMAPQPKDRYRSVAEFRTALEPFFRTTKGGSLTTPATPMPANVTPSSAAAMSPVSIPSPVTPETMGGPPGQAGLLPHTPATNAPDDPLNRAVPKTIPPDEASAPAAASIPLAAMSDPFVGMAPQGTPIGGFAVSQAASGGAASTEGIPSPAPQEAAMGFAATGLAPTGIGAGMPATVDAAPYMAGNHGAMASGPFIQQGLPPTMSAPPLSAQGGGLPATAYDQAMYNPQARPGGTAVGASPYNGGAAVAGYPMVQQNTHAGLPETAAMNPMAGPGGGYVDGSRKKPDSGTSVFAILMIAASITALVVGGLYLAQTFLRPVSGDGDATSASGQPTTQVTAPTTTSTGVAADPQPQPTTPPATPTPQPYTTTPKSTSTWTGTSKPPASTTTSAPTTTTASIPPPMLPTSFPTIVIPTAFPGFPLPGQSMPHPTIPGSQPTASPPQPTSTGTTPAPTSTRPRINVPKQPKP